jgi:UDP-N-acetylmuramoyl-tripeptide--D-alanyl-D-alanine ligase
MRQFHLEDLLKATDAVVLSRHQELFDGVGSDTRLNLSNQLFIALKGDNFDAHQFLTKATAQGAAALLIHDQALPAIAELKNKVTIVLVKRYFAGAAGFGKLFTE